MKYADRNMTVPMVVVDSVQSIVECPILVNEALKREDKMGITKESYQRGISTRQSRYSDNTKIINGKGECRFCGKLCKNSIALSNHE